MSNAKFYKRLLAPDQLTAIDGDLSVKATPVKGGKIRVELHLDGELAAELRAAAMRRNRCNRRGRQRPRSD